MNMFNEFGKQLEMFAPSKPEKTLKDAKQEMMKEIKDGTICPCCDRYIKLYRRKVHRTIALGLIELYLWERRNPGKTWITFKNLATESERFYKYCGDGIDLATLRYWGLLEESGEVPTRDIKSSGLYRTTPKGIRFVRNIENIPKYAYVLRNEVQSFSPEQISIVECLGNKFSYSELMQPTEV